MWGFLLALTVGLLSPFSGAGEPDMFSDFEYPLILHKRGNEHSEVMDAKHRNLQGQEMELYLSLNIDSHWEQYLIPAPLAVALIGQLIVLGNGKGDNFQFYHEGEAPYQYIKHGYFQPTMIQLSNEAWQAFHEAHKNMDMIRLHMMSIPNNAKVCLKFLATGSPEVIKRFMGIPLGSIIKASKECVRLARATDEKFVSVMLLLGEIDEAVSTTKARADEMLRTLQIKLNQTKFEEERLQTQQQFTKKEFDKVSKQMEEDRKKYEEALAKIPTGWKAVGMELVRSLNPMHLINWVTHGFSSGAGAVIAGAAKSAFQHPEKIIQDQIVLNIADNVYNSFTKLEPTIENWLSSLEGKVDKAIENAVGDIGNHLLAISVGLETAKETLKGKTSRLTSTVVRILDSADHTVKNLKNAASSVAGATVDLVSSGKKNVTQLLEQTKSLVAQKSALGNPSSRQVGQSTQVGGGAFKNERYKAAVRQHTLAETTQRYDFYFKEVLELNKEMTNILLRLSSIDISTAHWDEIRKVIQQGIAAISKLKEQWGQMIRFFEIISSVASVTMQSTVNEFFNYTQEAGKVVSVLGDDALEPVRDVLGEEAVRLATVAKFLYTLSDTYVNVSDSCIMDRLAGISKLQTIDDPAKQQAELKRLFDGTKTAQDKIVQLADRKRKLYKIQVKKQEADIEHIYDTLGQPTESDKQAISDAKKDLKDAGYTTNSGIDFDCPMC